MLARRLTCPQARRTCSWHVSLGVGHAPPPVKRERCLCSALSEVGAVGSGGGPCPPPRQPRGSAEAAPSPSLICEVGCEARRQRWKNGPGTWLLVTRHDGGEATECAIRPLRRRLPPHPAPPPERRRRRRGGPACWSSPCRALRADHRVRLRVRLRGRISGRCCHRKDGRGRPSRMPIRLPRTAAWPASGRRGR